MFQGTQKSRFYFSRDYGCEVTVNNVWESIFSMFWFINQQPLELVKFQSSDRFSRMLESISYLSPMCCNFLRKKTVTNLVWGAVPLKFWNSMTGPHPASQSRVGKTSTFLIFLKSRSNFLIFIWNFAHFLPHFGPTGGRLVHPGRPWLRHCQ